MEDKDVILDLIADNEYLRKQLKYEREVMRPNMLEIVRDGCINTFQQSIELSLLNIEDIIMFVPQEEKQRIERHISDIRFLFRKRQFEKEEARRNAKQKV
jgi:hypothetical protein